MQGVIVTALSYYMQMWTIAKRGPVFLAMSMPLTLIFTIIISSFVLGEAVSLGRYARPELLMKLHKCATKLYSITICKLNFVLLYFLSSIIAGILLIGGLYNVLWGKSME